jgi:hypothetical protein
MTIGINLRLPEELHANLRALAESDRRSLNAEIVWLLEEALSKKEKRS